LKEHARPITRAFVIHPEIAGAQRAREPALALEEAVSLARALPDLEVVGAVAVRLRKPDAGRLFGKGKREELHAAIAGAEAELVLVDGPLSPVQQRNLEKLWEVKILDRTGLILEIFSDRAATREGVLQVEMAALSYQRTRLVRAWTHLERQRGGLGFVGGPGETQIEADRRAIDEQLVRLRRQLDKVARTRTLHRAARAKVPFPVVALVGYTNAGKSTLFNRLTGADVLAKDMLFATLDPTMRRVALPGGGPEVILSDTVGFISDLPTELVAAFRATLEEVLAADLIVVDEAVPRLEVWNKIDRLDEGAHDTVLTQAARSEGVLALSAVTGEGLAALVSAIGEVLAQVTHLSKLHLGFDEGRRRAWLFGRDLVEDERQGEDGFDLTVRWSARDEARFRAL
jgi:GTP-binding protein HflX